MHSVDFAVFLYGVNSETIEIKWDGTFFQYGIGVTINKPSDYRGHNTLDVSKTSIWQKLVGQFIMDIEITWEEFGVATLGEPIREGHYPQWIKLKFSNDQDVIISAAELRDSEEKALVFMDNLLVIDDVGLAKKLNSI